MVAVTADTNIWISAFNYRGKPRRLIEMAEAGKIELAISDTIIAETRRILHERFDWAPDRIDMAEAEMRRLARHITPRVTLDVVKDDPADNRIVECAVSAGSEFIVTGDKDLLRIGVYDSIRMITVSDFLGLGPGKAR